jgi:hypothetical protein
MQRREQPWNFPRPFLRWPLGMAPTTEALIEGLWLLTAPLPRALGSSDGRHPAHAVRPQTQFRNALASPVKLHPSTWPGTNRSSAALSGWMPELTKHLPRRSHGWVQYQHASDRGGQELAFWRLPAPSEPGPGAVLLYVHRTSNTAGRHAFVLKAPWNGTPAVDGSSRAVGQVEAHRIDAAGSGVPYLSMGPAPLC